MVFNWFRKNKSDSQQLQNDSVPINKEDEQVNNSSEENIAGEVKSSAGYFSKLKDGLAKTRSGFADIFGLKTAIDDELLEELEMRLLSADVGVEVTKKLIDNLKQEVKNKNITDAQDIRNSLADHMHSMLAPYEEQLDISASKPYVILMIGVNGAGKTTTIGKLADKLRSDGKKIMLAAGDTFRAAAVEQLQKWGEKNNVPVIAQKTGADSASVAYDALESARAKDCDILLIDTAGRLHTQNHLMEELKKIKRVLQKLDTSAPQQTILVIDACNGQNALKQALEFHNAMQLDGLIITKLDGTAKGGIIFAITEKLHLPVRFIGTGEKTEDLRTFNARDFVEALLYND